MQRDYGDRKAERFHFLQTGGHLLSTDLFRLDNKAAVVTGAASGIGEAIARTFAARGAMVHVLDLDGERAAALAREIAEGDGTAVAHACDVADREQVLRVFGGIRDCGRIDILVNNAGIAHVGNLEQTTPADLDRIYRVNVQGIYHCMHACIGSMRENGGGVIVNLASVAASVGIADRFAYSMSKGAVLAMTLSVARDYAPDKIRCVSISPARVHTPFVDGFLQKNYPGREREMFDKLSATQPIGRMGKPQEVADLTLYLCSDAAAFVTGADYPIDGGFIRLHG